MKLQLAFAGALLLGAPALLGAQTAESASQTQLIQALMARMEQLERRVTELEEARGATSAVPPTKPATEDPHQHSQPPTTVADAQPTYPSLKLAGFSDFTFEASDRPRVLSGFSEGQFIVHLSSALSQKVSFLGEMSFTARRDAGTGLSPATGFNAEVERSIIRFEQNDYFKLSFGRYHTPVNYWNTAFHHGQWLQTTASRPEMTQFGGSFIPVHFIGALVEGALPAAGWNLNYNLGLGNGRGAVISRGGDFGDVNNNRAWVISLFARPDRPYGLQVGGSVYRDKISPIGGPETREWIQSGHIVWQKETPELIAEFANVTHRGVGDSRASHSQAWYVQTAYRLPWFDRVWKPYYRFEYIHIPKSDAIFRLVPGLAGSTVGLRFDVSSFAALKFEYRNQRRPGLPRVNAGFVQTSFTF